VSGNVQADAGYFYSTGAGITQLLLNSTGSDYATIQNDRANTWSLGHKLDATTGLGTAVMSWTAGGNVGVGTTTPLDRLQVVGNVQAQNGYFYANGQGITQLLLNSAGSDWGTIQNDQGNVWSLGHKTNTAAVPGLPVLSWTAGGKVGIGTTTPANPLSVAGVIQSTSGGFKFPDGSVQASVGLSLVSTTGSSLTGNGTASSPLVVNLSGTYSSAVAFSNTANSFTGNGAGLTNVNAATLGGKTSSALAMRTITYLAGCDSCGALTTSDSQRNFFDNLTATMTITSVTCFADTGSPVINVQRDSGGVVSNILATNLTCNGTPTTSFAFGQTTLFLNDKLNFLVAAPDGLAHRITLAMQATLN
jgi:hypothetical protein